MNFITTESENYYVLIMINNNIDLDLVNNKVEVIGIYSSKENAEIKINNLLPQVSNNLNPKYIIQGPFVPEKLSSNPRPNLRPNLRSNRRPNLRSDRRPNLIPNPDIFNPAIFNPAIFNPEYFHNTYPYG